MQTSCAHILPGKKQHIKNLSSVGFVESFLEPMERYSTELQELFRKTLAAWLEEKTGEEEVHITSSTIMIEAIDDIQVVEIDDFVIQSLKVPKPTTLEKYMEDLER